MDLPARKTPSADLSFHSRRTHRHCARYQRLVDHPTPVPTTADPINGSPPPGASPSWYSSGSRTALAGPQPVLSATTCGAHRHKAFNGHVQVLTDHIGFRRGSCPWSPVCPMTLPLLGLTHCQCCVGQPRWDCALPCTRATPGPAPASRPWPRTPTRTPTDTRWCNEPIAWAVTVPFQMHNNPVVRGTVGIVILKACLGSSRRISRVCCTECRRGFEKM